MNIFVTSPCPEESALVLPDSHIKKMAIECCQMLAYVASPFYNNYGTIPKIDGEAYKTGNAAHRKHPCTIWVAKSIHNATWLLYHGLMICEEFERRFGHSHGTYKTLLKAFDIFPEGNLNKTTTFIRAMDDNLKNDNTIDTFTAYKLYINSKPWVSSDYKKIPSRKPIWIN
jgi:hypothetical protein